MDVFKALEIGYMVLRAIKNFFGGQPAVIEFSYRGVAYRNTTERVSSVLERALSGNTQG